MEAKITLADGRVINNPFLGAAQQAQKSQQQSAAQQESNAGGLASLGKATYSWARPEALAVAQNTYNAKTLPYSGTYGVGLANYGWNESNILDKIKYSRDKFSKGDKSGGYKEIYEKMGEWADKYNPKLKTFLDTGNIPQGLKMDTVLQAADYGLRGLGQKQQNKKGFFDSTFGKVLGTALTIGASAINPALGAGVGAAWGGASGGLKGAVLGGLSGYGSGKFIGGFRAGAPTSFVGPVNPSSITLGSRISAGLRSLPGAGFFGGASGAKSGIGALGLGNNLTTGMMLGQGMMGMMQPGVQAPQAMGLQNFPNAYQQLAYGGGNVGQYGGNVDNYMEYRPDASLSDVFKTDFDVQRDPKFGVE